MSADPPRRPHPAAPRPAAVVEPSRVVLVGFSTRLPVLLVRRLQTAAPHLQRRQAEIAADAIDRWLTDHGH